MKKTIYLKSIFLLCTLLGGVMSAHAEDYEWVKVTDLLQVESGDLIVLADENQFALRNNDLNGVFAVSVPISDDKILDENVGDNIKWTLTKQVDESDGTCYFKFAKENGSYLSVENGSDIVVGSIEPDPTTDFCFKDYGDNGGKLYFGDDSFIKLENSNGNYKAVVGSPGSTFTLYKRTVKNYVKWKRIDSNNVNLEEDAVIVVIDLKSGRALSNDKADKDPDAVVMTLNDDKDRIVMDEVPEKVQWIFNRTQGKGITLKTKDDNYLYADTDNKGLKVGDTNGDNRYFGMGCTNDILFSLWTEIENDSYLFGVEESMFSNTWKLVKTGDYDGEDLAFYKKVVDPQKIVKIELAEYYNFDLNTNYTLDMRDFEDKVTITGAEKSEIKWSSSNPDVATINEHGIVTLIKRGTTVITASVEEDTENYSHDKASAKCTVIIDDRSTAEVGSLNLPLTVAEAKELAETGKVEHDGTVVLTWEEGVYYYIKGKVSKVNSGMMAMFGDMDFGEMMGGSGSSSFNFEDSMDDMDFDMEDMEESGFDMSSMGFDMSSLGFDMSALFGSSDKVTYYISDDGTKDDQMKVINGCGTLNSGGSTAMEFDPIPKLSPGDCVVVCGPLVYTEDTSMFSGMMDNNNSDEPKMSGKVDEMNYLAEYDPTLLITSPEQKEIYVNKTLDGSINAKTPLYTIDELFDRFNENKFPDGVEIQPATYKSSDEEIAKCEESEDKTTTIITGVNEGKAKITVKVKVILTPDDPNTDDNEEKSYTMKRKFKLIVKTRDLDPAGYYDGEWKLTTTTDSLFDGTRLVLVGTRVKDDNATDYMMVENNAMMGGGKNGSKIEFDAADTNKEKIESETVIKKKGLEVVLEQADDGTSWYLNVGEDENGTPLYLYASVKEESSGDQNQQSGGTGTGTGTGTGGFNMDEMMEMFNPSSGLKVGTKAGTLSKVEGVDSLKATISFSNSIATIKFPAVPDDKNNTIMLSSSFDMESMMGMFGGMGGNNEEEDNPDEPADEEEESTFDMGSFDMFMASFNTKKPGDEQEKEDEETGETKAPKCFMPRIYRFVPYTTFKTAIGTTEWKTIVTYKDAQVSDDVEAFVVTSITPGDGKSLAHLEGIGSGKLKGGEPYLLHSPSGNYTLTLLTPYAPDELSAPETNLLHVSTRTTSGEKGNTSVYVLANKTQGVGFYKWVGGDLGRGRVYLPVEASVEGVNDFCSFLDSDNQPNAIQEIERSDLNNVTYYDLQGRRVMNPTKGVYVVKGRKVIFR